MSSRELEGHLTGIPQSGTDSGCCGNGHGCGCNGESPKGASSQPMGGGDYPSLGPHGSEWTNVPPSFDSLRGQLPPGAGDEIHGDSFVHGSTWPRDMTVFTVPGTDTPSKTPVLGYCSQSDDGSTTTTTYCGGGRPCPGESDAPLFCNLYICTGGEGRFTPCGDAAARGWDVEAANQRKKGGGAMRGYAEGQGVGPVRKKTGAWNVLAILEYSCECDPSPSIEWYKTVGTGQIPEGYQEPGPGGDKKSKRDKQDLVVRYKADPGPTMKEDMKKIGLEKQGTKSDNGASEGVDRLGGPWSGGGTPSAPKACYLMVMDSATGDASRNLKGQTYWTVVGRVEWTCTSCGRVNHSTCRQMKSYSLKAGPIEAKPEGSKVKRFRAEAQKRTFNETQMDRFDRDIETNPTGSFQGPAPDDTADGTVIQYFWYTKLSEGGK